MSERKSPPEHVTQTALELWRKSGGQTAIPISGQSMLPFIHPGDRVRVGRGLAIRRGDVIVFQQEGKLVAHRVLRVIDSDSGATFFTSGDNVLRPDPPVPTDRALGRVTAILRDESTIDLDTPVWRRLGMGIALTSLPVAILYGKLQELKHKYWQPQPDAAMSRLHRTLNFCFTLPLKAINFLLEKRQ